jgi:RIO-like serine/threonine protein kinase
MKTSARWFSPDVIRLTAPCGVQMVLKDYRRCPKLVRATWGRFVASREASAYQRLEGMKGVPQFIARLDAYAFAVELLDAKPLPRRKYRDQLGLRFFTLLENTVREMHSRGVAHGDLRRHNILIGSDGHPCLIDFETAVSVYHPIPVRFFFRMVREIDYITILKIRSRYFPEQISDADRKVLGRTPWHLKAGRFLRQRVYRPLTRKGSRQLRRERKRAA